MSDLPTIVIPYFKLRYLDSALASLAAQTRPGAKIFVGDDASPEDPSEVLRKYRGRLDVDYRRFPNNLGGTSLAGHWNRCVRETKSEWVWLFSDDDVASPDSVESFGKTVAATRGEFDVYRFNTRVIDANDEPRERHPEHPRCESAADFAMAKILAQRSSYAVEHIFRRGAFDTAGGFVDFPLAWCSDDASWVAFARRTGFRTMDRGEVLWRKSGLNVSTPKPEYVGQKLAAYRRYLLWLQQQFPDEAFQSKLRTGIGRLFPDQLQHWGGKPKLAAGLRFWMFFCAFTKCLNFRLLRALLGMPTFWRRTRLPAEGLPRLATPTEHR